MSNNLPSKVDPVKFITELGSSFEAAAVSAYKHSQEVLFAIHAIQKTQALARVASINPESLKRAYLQLAAVGLTLNPVLKLCYLVPRDGHVVLDISYQGLKSIAEESGSIKKCKAVLIRKNDVRKYNGPFVAPLHEYDPCASIADRGEIVGGYSIAILNDDSPIVDFMSIEELLKIKALSPALDSSYSPYNHFEDQMFLKTLIKRGYKSWPRTNTRLAQAIDYLNTQAREGLENYIDGYAEVIEQPLSDVEREEFRSSQHIEDFLIKIFNRAKNNQWSAAEDYLRERSTNPRQLLYMLERLAQFKQEYIQNPVPENPSHVQPVNQTVHVDEIQNQALVG